MTDDTFTDAFSDAERQLLAARAAAVAKPVTATRAPGRPSVFFRVGRQRCSAPARSVRAIIRLDGLSPAPASGRALAGGIVRGGEVIPVFHLAAVLGEKLENLPETAHALVLGAREDEVALSIDDLDGFGDVDETVLRPAPDEARSPYIQGATVDGVLVIDLDALLASDVLWVDASRFQGGN